MPGGRKKTWTKEKIAETNRMLNEYIDETAIPILVEFCYKHDIRRATLYEIPDLAYTIKRMMEKKESQLEKLAISGRCPPAFAIFSLKQLGWKDRQEVEQTSKSKIIIEVVDPANE